MIYYLTYLAAISFISIFVTIYDKKAAISGKWRIRESTLLVLALLGGAIAMLITMKAIRHKTKHKKFMIGIPLIIILRIVLIYLFIKINYGTMLL